MRLCYCAGVKRFLVAAVVICLASGAAAADMPVGDTMLDPLVEVVVPRGWSADQQVQAEILVATATDWFAEHLGLEVSRNQWWRFAEQCRGWVDGEYGIVNGWAQPLPNRGFDEVCISAGIATAIHELMHVHQFVAPWWNECGDKLAWVEGFASLAEREAMGSGHQSYYALGPVVERLLPRHSPRHILRFWTEQAHQPDCATAFAAHFG